MTTETLMTEAATTTEGQAASQAASPTTEAQPGQGGEQTANQQQATEGQTTEAQKAEGGTTEGEQEGTAQKAGAPEQYEFQAPEGQQFDEAVIGAFSEIAKELDLSQDAAQKVLDKVAPVIAARQAENLQAARTEWAETSKADKEFGGDKLTENLAIAQKARDAFATPEFVKLLNDTGLGNHPEMIRVFYRAGKAISEDRIVTGAQGATATESAAQRMYPNMNP